MKATMITEQQLDNAYVNVIGCFIKAREEAMSFLTTLITDGATLEIHSDIWHIDRYGMYTLCCRTHYIRREGDEVYVYLCFEDEVYCHEYTLDDLDNSMLYQVVEKVFNYFKQEGE